MRVPPGELIHQLSNPVVRDAFVVSPKTTPDRTGADPPLRDAARLPARDAALPGRAVPVTLVELPLVLPPAVAGIGLLASSAVRGSLDAGRFRPHSRSRRRLSCSRSRSSLARSTSAGDRGLRGGRPEPCRGLADARRRPGAHLLPGRSAARGRRARRRRGAGIRARARRVRRDDHVRGQPSGGHPDAAACDLCEFEADFDVAVTMGALLVVVSVALLISLKLVFGWQPSQRTSHSSSLVRAEARARGRGRRRARRPVGAGKTTVLRRDRRPDPSRLGSGGARRRGLARRREGA